MTRTTLVWDVPVRVFHVCFGVGWIVALAIALGTGQSSRTFPYHSLVGLMLGWLVAMRLVWGFVGTRPARVSELFFGPVKVFAYVRDAILFRETMYAGHNPGAAWVTIGMLVLTVAQVMTGLTLGSGNEGVKDVHEFLAYAMIALIAAHLAGVALHTMRHRELIGLSMVDGKRRVDASRGIASARPWSGVVFALAALGACVLIVRGYDPVRQTTTVLGVEISIGESEEEME